MRRGLLSALFALLLVPLAGCTSVGGSAVRTGAARLPPYAGPVRLYLANPPAANAVELGVVEVHGSQMEATIETLLPLFVKKAAALGANAAIIDRFEPRFEWVAHPMTTTYAYACGFRATCVGTSTTMMSDEVLTLSLQGRAARVPVDAP